MEIVVKGRHTEVSERFRQHAVDKLSKLERFDHKVIRLEVEVSREHNPRLSRVCERVELTCHSKGPVIRAEANADDPWGALDLACGKLEHRLRKLADRRRVHHGRRTPVSVADATAVAGEGGDATEGAAPGAGADLERRAGVVSPEELGVDGDGPLVVREKVHHAAAMTLDQALFEMELVGHDFFLFADKESGLASVVYRRRGYDYGVLRLQTED